MLCYAVPPLQINVQDCARISDKSGRKLGRLPNLRYLNVSGTSMGDETMAQLPRGIRILHCKSNPLVSNNGVDYIIDLLTALEVGAGRHCVGYAPCAHIVLC